MQSRSLLDTLIIGGGPAGLTAALYLARYRRTVLVVDAAQSRAAMIPVTHNHPGFAGIAGEALLARMGKHALRFGASIETGYVEQLLNEDGVFIARCANGTITARTIILATGIKDVPPELEGRDAALAAGALRYCPVCDGFEAIGKNIAVVGDLVDVRAKALFLRTYSDRVSILAVDRKTTDHELTESDVQVLPPPMTLRFNGEGVDVQFSSQEMKQFDTLYAGLGCQVFSELATSLGAKYGRQGCLKVDEHQQTTVPGLYAAGDVVSDLHQLCVAECHAAIEATAIHNSLPLIFSPRGSSAQLSSACGQPHSLCANGIPSLAGLD